MSNSVCPIPGLSKFYFQTSRNHRKPRGVSIWQSELLNRGIWQQELLNRPIWQVNMLTRTLVLPTYGHRAGSVTG